MICELILRVGHISHSTFYTSNFYTGVALRPGAEGLWRKEGEAYVQINSAGFRDREHTIEKSVDTLRVAVLGDSYAEAMQVPLENAFWSVLEMELGKCPSFRDRNIEVLNFGVSGYGTAQELMVFRFTASHYSPDIVLLAFGTGNDVRNNLRALEGDPMRPYFVFKDGHLELDASFRDSFGFRVRQLSVTKILYKAIDYSRVLQLLNAGKNKLKEILTQITPNAEASDQKINTELGLDEMVYLKPKDPLWREAWQITDGLILIMRDEVERTGATFLIATLTNGIQVYPDALHRKEYLESLGVPNLFYPDFRVKTLGAQEGIHVLNLVFPFLAYADRHQVFLHGFEKTGMGYGHWNSQGHRLGGTLIAEKICSEFPPTQLLN